jgi:hypothetical protein
VPKKQLASEVLIDLHRRLSVLPSRSHERRMIMQETAHLYGISEQTLYRALAQRARPKALRRSDRGTPRVVPQEKMEYYCELIAAIKVRTSNKKGRHLSTGEAIRLIEKFGIETPDGLVKAPESTFKKSTVNQTTGPVHFTHRRRRNLLSTPPSPRTSLSNFSAPRRARPCRVRCTQRAHRHTGSSRLYSRSNHLHLRRQRRPNPVWRRCNYYRLAWTPPSTRRFSPVTNVAFWR